MHWDRAARFLFLTFCLVMALSFFTRQAVFATDDLAVLSKQADDLAQQKNYAKALEIYESILTEDPSIIGGYRGLVTCYGALGDPQGALIFLEGLYLDDPDKAEVNYGLGYALFSVQQYKEAANYFERAIELNPDMPEAWNNRAAIYQFVENDNTKARKYYEQAIALAQKTENQRVLKIAQKNLAHIPQEEVVVPVSAHLTLEQFLNRFVAAAQASDTKSIRELVMGQKNNCQQAMNWFLEEALKASAKGALDKDNTAMLLANVLANIYQETFEDASLTKKKAKFDSLNQNQRSMIVKSETQLAEGLAYEQNGAFNQAINRYKAALAGYKATGLDRKIGITLVYIGDVHGKLMQYAIAQSAYEEALTYFDQSQDAEYKARILASLGQACFKMENYSGAVEYMEASLAVYRQLQNSAEASKLEKNIETINGILKD